jgi:hypothetical protein
LTLFPTEWLLSAALVAVYLFDSAHFLSIGEAVVVTRRGSPRQLSFGSAFELGGRRPFLPNPFAALWPELRIDWDVSGHCRATAAEVKTEMESRLRMLRPVGWLSAACAILIVIVAPVALVTGSERAFVAAALLCVVSAATACCTVLYRRRNLGLSGWQTASIVFVAMICLPCSGNLARAVAMQKRWRLPASELPALGFDAARIAGIEARLEEILARAQQFLAEDSAEYRLVGAQLQLVRSRLNERQ